MEGRVLRRSVTLADQLAAVGPAPSVAVAGPGGAAAAGSCNLRDLLKLRDEDDLASAGRRAAVTLASAMAAERQVSSAPSPSSSSPAAAAAARTLLDIIRDDQPPASGPTAAAAAAAAAGDPLVRRAVSLPPPTTATASPPALAPAAAEAAPPPPPPPPPPAAASADEEEQEQRVSLMALLEQTDRQWSAVPGGATQPEEEDSATSEALEPADDTELEPEAAGRGVVAGCCCVCMAQAKGAAFIPCGHTFCRTCARELLAGRGRCPLCNAAIVDVLDIF